MHSHCLRVAYKVIIQYSIFAYTIAILPQAPSLDSSPSTLRIALTARPEDALDMVFVTVDSKWVTKSSGQAGYLHSADTQPPSPAITSEPAIAKATAETPAPSKGEFAIFIAPDMESLQRLPRAPDVAPASESRTADVVEDLPICIQFCSDMHLELPLETKRFG